MPGDQEDRRDDAGQKGVHGEVAACRDPWLPWAAPAITLLIAVPGVGAKLRRLLGAVAHVAGIIPPDRPGAPPGGHRDHMGYGGRGPRDAGYGGACISNGAAGGEPV